MEMCSLDQFWEGGVSALKPVPVSIRHTMAIAILSTTLIILSTCFCPLSTSIICSSTLELPKIIKFAITIRKMQVSHLRNFRPKQHFATYNK